MPRKLNKDATDLWLDYGFHPTTRCIYLGTDDEGEDQSVNFQMARQVIKALHILETGSAELPIIAYLNTGGGDTAQGLAIYDAFTRSPCHVTIIGTGEVMSAGAVILQAADLRQVTKNTTLMLHYGSMGLNGSPGEVLTSVEDWSRQLKLMQSLFLEKIRIKQPKYRIREMQRLLEKDTYLTPEQALDLNLVDEVI